jgi:hypothetical protein
MADLSYCSTHRFPMKVKTTCLRRTLPVSEELFSLDSSFWSGCSTEERILERVAMKSVGVD